MIRLLAAITLALAASGATPAQTGARPGPQTGARAGAQSRPQTPAEAARRELDAGARFYRAGRFAEAEQRFRRALELDPDAKNARLYIARAVQQQYKPGDETPENLAAGERAVAAYQELLKAEPLNDAAFKSVLAIYGEMKREDKAREFLLWRANDFSASAEKRAEAFTALASKQWQCSYDLTERKENKKTTQGTGGATTVYTMPADAGDLIRARQCVTEGLAFAEQAASLAPKNSQALTYKANLLREAAKLAEMEGDAAQKAEYERQYAEALGQSGVMVVAPTATPETAADETKRKTVVSGGVLNGKAVSKPQPEYPPVAKAAGASGTVTVQVVVDEEGNVISAAAVSGHPLLQQAAVAAARQAKFSPTLLQGQPVRVSGVVTYNFVPE